MMSDPDTTLTLTVRLQVQPTVVDEFVEALYRRTPHRLTLRDIHVSSIKTEGNRDPDTPHAEVGLAATAMTLEYEDR
jgi:hypothetical protein